MKQPFFSVIIPTLNEETYLPGLLSDLTKQTEKDFSVIIVDGNSTDNTKKCVQAFASTLNPNFHSIKTRNVSHQRNTGAEYSDGHYLVFLDADCRLEKDFLKKAKQYLKKHRKLFLVLRMLPQESEKELYDEYIFNALNYLVEFSQLTKKPFACGGWMIVEHALFEFLGGFNKKLFLSEDHDLVQRARVSGVKAAVPKDLFVYVSMRRFQKEGRMKVITKYLISTLHTVRGQKIHERIFDYEMGGQHYSLPNNGQKSFTGKLRQYAQKVKNALSS
ncbi:hypothetical protein A3B02_00705 [Candidatus Roizmanbacteria bacterium RIFCSPLOWO2_01_FULL_42_14]|uniref:Glycosyltransferase 2-like domain-containing protein n=4 Tax=Candidatus Roizmaniibacteriota TaxID=1752723 RepID=A0A1F7K1Z9_9BACT|nr:MAG: hypothetical protein A3D08_02260 [Candidatus Roizmanbacteria bacterium RIFCSPHIGHO2_02_FULL_43_11]OGK38842.1 MAG: hypothetical protein A3F32_02075 [Candidatus Roizmanbacteria bacterium RIFCSPHIGHO2_12_FULL_42_10]OGK52602.1 MAG: hypothetical protein A3B02_00705 [Candidatus Roizmanbacteria bacterium RIFCSPLOWO2_01_FULL_42_14]OGK61856.1 MAG: hypothetical protein A3I56_02740 [Candidatus Roizmanbacteria bacterium RIFCSPLOWO2_02_FULL_43_10]